MINPFTAWSRMVVASSTIANSSIRVAEIMSASLSVIATRSEIIRAAMADPLHADSAELLRMVPEKIAAFSHAGEAMMRGLMVWNKLMQAEARYLGDLALRGRALSPGDWIALAQRGNELGLAAAEQTARVGSATLAPVHAKATANARRLGQRRR